MFGFLNGKSCERFLTKLEKLLIQKVDALQKSKMVFAILYTVNAKPIFKFKYLSELRK